MANHEKSRGRRLLILEFLVVDRCRNDSSHYFPYYARMARDAGAEVLWLAYGCDFHMEKRGYCVDLPPADLASLARQTRRLRPTHILSSEFLARRTAQALVENAADAEYVSMRAFMEGSAPTRLSREGPERTTARPRQTHIVGMWKLQSLDNVFLPYPWMAPKLAARPGQGAPICMTDLESDYDARIMNELGRSLSSFVRIMGGHHCSTTVPLAGNPFLKGINLRRYPSPYGCTYCSVTGRGDRNVVFPRDPVATAVRQLKRIVACVGTAGRNSAEYDIYNTQVFLQLERFFDELLKVRFPPGTFHFSPRIDDFLNTWGQLNRVLPRLAQAGHSLHILRMGIENFSPAEQGRFNKGIATAQAVEGFYRIKDLKARFPKNFSMTSFGFILYSPWTTLADLRFNLAVTRMIGFPVCGHWLTSVVQMDSETPLVYAARRDGLFLERTKDPGMLYDTWRCRCWRRDQHAFRFLHREVAVVFQTIVRIVAYMDRGKYGEYFSERDADFQRVVDFLEGLPEADRGLRGLGELFVAAAEGLPAKEGIAGLLRRARAILAKPAWRDRLREGEQGQWLDDPSSYLLGQPEAHPFAGDRLQDEAARPS